MNTRLRLLVALSICSTLACCTSKTTPSSGSGTASQAQPSRPWGSPDLTSNLSVPAGQRFIFAGGQKSGFTAFATNRGTVPITIIADLDGVRREIGIVAPGERVSHTFAPREAALFENPSAQVGDVKVEVWGQTNVGMRYTPIANP